MGCPKILAVDDEPAILRIIKDSLGDKFLVLVVGDGQNAIAMALNEKPDLILIDNIMPGIGGLDVVRLIRQANAIRHIPIIMVTALTESVDRIEAYNAGVDDFISKPFHPDELLARVESKLERFKVKNESTSEKYKLGNLKADFENSRVEIKGHLVHLTNIEMSVFQILLSEINKVVPRQKILKSVWSGRPPDERLLDIHIATLRKKIKDFDHEIETVYGKGYVIRSKTE